MDNTKEIMERLDRLESKDSIRELISNYAIACDQQDIKFLEKLFTKDAAFDSPNGSMKCNGRQNILDMYVDILKTRGPSFHWTHDANIKIKSEDSDLDSGTVYSHAETTPNGEVSLAAMKYDDEYSRKEGSWKFLKRTINFVYYVKTSEYTEKLNNPLRVFIGGENVMADIPEKVPAWINFKEKYKD